MNAEVLIAGAGPAGLTAAIVLAQRGRQVMIVDAQAKGANTSRAAVVHSRTLEVLEPYGVADRLAAHGIHTPVFTIRDRDKVLVPVPFDGLPTAYPYTLMISQADTEACLLARLEELGGKVIRPARVSGIEQDADGVTAALDDGQRIRAAYLIGADGLSSTVRQSAGIGFTGGTYAESFVLADVRLPSPAGRAGSRAGRAAHRAGRRLRSPRAAQPGPRAGRPHPRRPQPPGLAAVRPEQKASRVNARLIRRDAS